MSQGIYDDTHRTFLQALIARQVITFAEAKPLLAKIQTVHDPERPVLDEDVTREDFEHYVNALNEALSPFDMEIRNTLHQKKLGHEVFALVNTVSDALTQMATTHSADEIAFVKRVLDCMFETNNTAQREIMALSGQQALQLARAPGDARRESGVTQAAQGGQSSSLTMSHGEKVLKNMVDEGWFERSSKGFYSLSPRALMELRAWLIDTYNDTAPGSEDDDDDEVQHRKIKFCDACRSIITVGQRCPDPNLRCLGRLHNHCVEKLFRAQSGKRECPECKTAWTDPLPVGEKAVFRSRGSGGGTQGAAQGARRRTTNGNTDGADEE